MTVFSALRIDNTATTLRIIMQTEVRKMSQEEALKRIVTEYPEYTTQAMQDIKDGVDLVEVLSLLDSY